MIFCKNDEFDDAIPKLGGGVARKPGLRYSGSGMDPTGLGSAILVACSDAFAFCFNIFSCSLLSLKWQWINIGVVFMECI